jgi:hypothetical protein
VILRINDPQVILRINDPQVILRINDHSSDPADQRSLK